MTILEDIIEKKIIMPSQLEFINLNEFCIIDIETTGFHRERDTITLIGALYFDETSQKFKIKQWFLDKPLEEADTLKLFSDFIDKFRYIISYNGDSFDIPFLEAKLKKYDLNKIFKNHISIDLLKVVRKHKSFLNLDNCKLKTVESLLNINRIDKLSGKDCVFMYLDFLSSGDTKCRDLILSHNFEDILYLADILKIYDLIPNEEIIKIKLNNSDESFLILSSSDIKIKKQSIVCSGKIQDNTLLNKNIMFYGDVFELEFDFMLKVFNFKIIGDTGLLSSNNNCLFLNLSEFDFNLNLIDSSIYSVPENIFLLSEESCPFTFNIASLIVNILKELN